MKEQLTQITKPGETYIRLGHMIKKMAPGERMAPFSKLLKELGITQRSLDIAYNRLVEDGVLEIKKQSGVFVKKPYAGGTFLFAAAEDVFLSHRTGENLRLYFAELRRKIHHYFPGSRLEIVLSESPDKQHYDREPQLCEQLFRENKLNRILGVFVSYHVTEQKTVDIFDSMGIPFVDLDGDSFRITDLFRDVKIMVSHLHELGMERIEVISSKLPDSQEVKDYLTVNKDVKYQFVENSMSDDMVESGISYIKNIIKSGDVPEAFAVCDDYFCQGMLIGAYMEGIKLEEECRVITSSQQGVPIHSNSPVMRLNYCWEKIADVATELMGKKLLEEDVKGFVKVDPELEM